MRRKPAVVSWSALCLAALLGFAPRANAQPSADQVLSDIGWSTADKQRIMAGEFLTKDATNVSERDLAVSMGFLVKTSPAELSEQIMAGKIVGTDPQVRASGTLSGAGSLAELADLHIQGATAQALVSAQPGQALNLSSGEIAAFSALQSAGTPAVEQQLQKILLARYQAYKRTGLAGIAPYDRGGSSTDVGAELRNASQAATVLAKYLPAFLQVLIGYPGATLAGMRDTFSWVSYDIDGTPTFVLTQELAATDGAARVVAQRQFYVSTGYNAEQAVAGFLPVKEGTVVAYTNHTFTDQVAGFGGGLKRDIGRRMMASKLKEMFEKARNQVAQ